MVIIEIESEPSIGSNENECSLNFRPAFFELLSISVRIVDDVVYIGSANVDFTVHSEADLESSPEASYEFDYYASAA